MSSASSKGETNRREKGWRAMSKEKMRNFHQARWDEPFIFEMSVPGERGVLVPQPENEIEQEAGSQVLGGLSRKKEANLPEVNQMKVNRHYIRLSQETLSGSDVSLNISQGTCTMKYNPKVQEHIATRHQGILDVHPLQDPRTMQGLLGIYYHLESYLKEVSGLDRFSLQPGGGSQAIYTAACLMRAYHQSRQDHERTEIITTVLSHPVDAGAPSTAGFKVITLLPEENGLPSLAALKAALSNKTAGIFITNPEDSGIYNPDIDQFVQAVHDVGGLCFYDQANANALLGIARAKEAGFDMCHFNLHKTFAAPHGSFGPAAGAIGVKEFLVPFLPVPRVEQVGDEYDLVYDCPQSIGKVRSFFGNAPLIVRSYMWIRQLGAEGLRQAAITSVLNNNYMKAKIEKIRGVTLYYKDQPRLEQVRYSWEQLKEETGVGTEDITCRAIDYSIPYYHLSHHPMIVPEPFTLEPCESYNKADIDEYVDVLEKCAQEAYDNPEIYKGQPPFRAAGRLPLVSEQQKDEWEGIATTWRQYQKRYSMNKELSK
jgi:glycine dehydrogenase subunit 2